MDIAGAIKAEDLRLAKKVSRQETAALRGAVTAHRKSIAALKKEVADLRRQQGQLQRTRRKASELAPADESTRKVRFSAARLKARRSQLNLSREQLASLAGVSAQSPYVWESERGQPTEASKVALAQVLKLGKRELKKRLAEVV